MPDFGVLSSLHDVHSITSPLACAVTQVHDVELVQTDLVAGLLPRLEGAVDLLVRITAKFWARMHPCCAQDRPLSPTDTTNNVSHHHAGMQYCR
jgi:hypothetical protein